MSFHSWKVAAAILVDTQIEMHYVVISNLVRSTGLTKLGTDAKTPELTIHRVMNHDHPEYFNNNDGFFSATQKAIDSSEIKSIIKVLQDKKVIEIKKTKEIQEIVIKDIEDIYEEGGRRDQLSSRYERNPRLRSAAISIHGTTCMVPGCNLNFEVMYGEHGKNFIEVHHLKPISGFSEKMNVNPNLDMVVVCSNCHSMIHRATRDEILSLENVGKLITNSRAKRNPA